MKKMLIWVVALATLGSMAYANGNSETSSASQKSVTVNFSTAPNQGQYNFWDAIVQQFNAANIQVDGKTVQVKVQMMPETPSSEAGIQNALATNTAPALSTNINRGFASTLVASGRIYDLQDDQFFKDIITARNMESIIPGWQIDGKQYVIPIYANAMGYHWNSKALRELGFADRVPTTVDDIKTLLVNFEKLKDTRMKELGISHVFLRSELGRPELWWNRWYDFEMQYDAFSQGKSLVTGNKLTMDPQAAKQVFEFLGMFGDTIQMAEDTTAFEKTDVPYVVQITAPWDVSKYDAAGMKYGLDGDYIYGPPIVLKKGDTPYTFADAKGIVFYKGGNVTEEMHKGAIAFISWVYSQQRNAQTDLDWFKTTGMLPMRGDTTTNPILSEYIAGKQILQDQAKLIPNSIPAMANGSMSDILTALGENGLCAYILKTATLKPFTAPDATTYVQKAMEDMKAAGSLQ
ncbi:ABC transporter substrate-binding protein [uncultured Sphaerochaeta sp.]|uniref:ABC transporter substrate-binding protein n=1 Tax=uncultured Sphaerochaeta sp. TaxID=886478 RepID=UPI002A0A7460|nr:ABC transporter substrate-binding protein [uncultured Sphaerochaeta sp.]